MGKFRVRSSKTVKKRSRWAKGQSSSSNPEKTKHRDAAKANRGFIFGAVPSANETLGSLGNFSQSKLTAENLLKHTAALKDGMVVADEEDDDGNVTVGQTVKTFDTFASDWTQCTNISFHKIMKRFKGTNAQHKEMLAVLAAVTEVIKSKGGEENNTEYFAALITTLEVVDTEESLTAVLTLLSIIIKAVSPEVLRAQFPFVSKLLLDLLSKYSQSDLNSAIRSLIGCLSVLLRAQSGVTWSANSTKQIYDSVLSYVTFSKPKVRKAAQHAIVAILKGSLVMINDDDDNNEDASAASPPVYHPMAPHTAKYCIQVIETNIQAASKNNSVMYILGLLKEILGCFPRAQVKQVCETVLKVMTMGNAFVVSIGMQAIYGLYSSRPNSSSLPAELNAQLLTALYDYQPSINDSQPIVAWLTVQQEALINLSCQDKQICLKNIPSFFSVAASKGWVSDKPEVVNASTTAIKCVINECLRPFAKEFCENADSIAMVEKIFTYLMDGLKYQYHSAWPQVFHVLSVFIDVFGNFEPCHRFFGQCLKSLAELRSSVNFTLNNELDFIVGKAIRRMGPRKVLEHIPLLITGREKNYDFPRSWLLPVLRENVQNTELSYFTEYFLPLASVCLQRSIQCSETNDTVGHKTYEILMYQIWSLLPGFCNSPIDLKTSFKGIAKILGTQLNQRKSLRMDILSSLRHLILKNTDNEDNKTELARFAKNFLPILFNLYTTEPHGSEEVGQRLAVLETIKSYISIAHEELVLSMFDTAMAKYHAEETESFVRESVLDLLKVMMSFQDEMRIEQLYEICIKQLNSDDKRRQKRAYKILEELCGSDSERVKRFVANKIKNIENLLLKSLTKASPSSQAARLRCLIHVVRRLDSSSAANVKFAHAIIPEAVLCIRAVNSKARASAYTLLVAIVESLCRWKDDTDAVLKDYLKVLLAGLAGNATLIHCTLLAITRIYYEFKDVFPDEVVDLLVSNVCLLLTSNSREVVGAALSFFRVFITSHNVLKSTKYINDVIKSLVNMSEDCKRHFRLKTRYLLDRIVRKFGYDFVAGSVPSSDVTMHKRLKNIRKLHARKSKLKEASEVGDDISDDEENEFRVKGKPKTIDEILDGSSDDDDEEDDKNVRRNKKTKSRQTFINEKSDDIMDFLDPTAAQKVMSSKPKKELGAISVSKRNKKSANGGFKLTPDGRLIIKDTKDGDDSDDDDQNEAEAEARRRKYMMMEDDDLDSDNENNENTFQKLVSSSAARKRKRGGSIASSKRTSLTTISSSTYKAGGSGIHRPLDKPHSEYGSEYRSKKAKGDVKRKGKPDPYAYIPLQKSNLNRRKKAKGEGQFKGLIKASKAGSKIGNKKNLSDIKKMMKKMKVK